MAGWEERFDDYVGRLGETLGHADRRAPLRAYTTGLLLPGERKSVEPMAARVDPARVGAAHQSLHRFVAKAAWDDDALLEAVRGYVLPALQERGPIRAWLVDDTFRLSEPRAEEWFLAEWPEGEEEPTEYWLSTLPEAATLEELVAAAKLRWRIERDFEELKQELGLGHFEGRGWRGFHHHASLCIAAYGFLVAERCRFSPPGWRPRPRAPERPADYRPRNPSPAPGAARPALDRDLAPASRCRADAPPAALPLLPAELRAAAC